MGKVEKDAPNFEKDAIMTEEYKALLNKFENAVRASFHIADKDADGFINRLEFDKLREQVEVAKRGETNEDDEDDEDDEGDEVDKVCKLFLLWKAK